MKEWEKLLAQAKEKLIAAKALLEGDKPDMAAVKALQDEAKALQERAEALKAVTAGIANLSEPVLPAALPTGADDNALPAGAVKDAAVKALYSLRFGEPEAAIKAVLVDLHGPDYEAKRWEQHITFNRWLRDYTNPAVPPILRQYIWSPDDLKRAILSGYDVGHMKSVMVEAQESLGGALVPADYQNRVVERLAALAVVRGRATVINTSRDSVEIPKSTGGDSQYSSAVRVTWVDETPTAGTAATNPTLGLDKVPVHTVMAETFLSRNQVEDSVFNLPEWLSRKFSEAGSIDEDNRFLTGAGAGTPEGILPGGANGLSLTSVSTGDGSDLVWGDDSARGLIGLTFAIDAQYRQNAAFIGEKATYERIARMVDGSGQHYWREQYGRGTSEGGAGTYRVLLGFPVLEQEAMPTIASTAYPLIFGDLTGYYIIDRLGMSVERYLDSATARINQVCYVMRRRLGGQVGEPWRFAVQYVSA
jgi:HK97 family phage major capsid protein